MRGHRSVGCYRWRLAAVLSVLRVRILIRGVKAQRPLWLAAAAAA